MRISDWSSDVCSSDLGVTARLETPAAGFVRLAYGFHPWLSVAVDGHEVAPIRTITGLVSIPVPAGPVDIEMRAEASALRRAFNGLSIIALRSEEHTSELQSLMRISYAVFCLQKTINTTDNQIKTY